MTMTDNNHCGTSILSASIYIWTLVKEENSLYETESSSFKLPQI